VKLAVAKKQITVKEAKRQADAVARAAQSGGATVTTTTPRESDSNPVYNPSGNGNGSSSVHETHEPPTPSNNRFFMSADLDTTRINRDVQILVEEDIQHLTSADWANVKVTLEVEALFNASFTQQTMRTVTENCRTLRVRDSGFEE
jgi:hypothetical protein